jgi:hypothetical protein
MSASVRSSLRAAVMPIFGLAVLFYAPGCREPDPNQQTEVFAPDYDQFKGVAPDGALQAAGVSRLLERRCGSLDCHGQLGRPLRIYGEYGLRLVQDGSFRPGVEPTSEEEYSANFAAVIGLQPEVMSQVVARKESPTDNPGLLLMRKPLLLERHKGGAVIESGDDAYTCLISWLVSGQADFAACASAVQ